MKTDLSDRLKYDPSDQRQTFSDLAIQLHCCHYWMILEWECNNLASPFWRLYYNTMGDASVIYKGVTTPLSPDRIILIPPNTPFSTRLKGVNENDQERHIRKKINRWDELEQMRESQASDQLFIHFNLNNPFDLIEPGIYSFPVSDLEEALLHTIKDYCIRGNHAFDCNSCATISCLLFSLIKEIPHELWEKPKLDKRVFLAISYIEKHLEERLSNKTLSDLANMVENSFARLFHENVGISIQQYIRTKRIDKAMILLHHSTANIDEVAQQCGFSDRFHFSKVFKERTGQSPAAYKRNLVN